MRNAALKPAWNGAALGRFCVLCLCLVLLSACGSTASYDRGNLAPPPPPFDPADGTGGINAAYTQESAPERITPDIAPGAGRAVAALNTDQRATCKLKHRFDRSATLAYNFSDQSRLALKMSLDGVAVNRAVVRFTYKFQKHKGKYDHCLYDSKLQGLLPSVYHELVTREDNTVWQELRAIKADLID